MPALLTVCSQFERALWTRDSLMLFPVKSGPAAIPLTLGGKAPISFERLIPLVPNIVSLGRAVSAIDGDEPTQETIKEKKQVFRGSDITEPWLWTKVG